MVRKSVCVKTKNLLSISQFLQEHFHAHTVHFSAVVGIRESVIMVISSEIFAAGIPFDEFF